MSTPLLGADNPEMLFVKIEGGRLSVKLRNALLAEVLREIGQEAGIGVRINETSGQKVSATFKGLRLEAGIKRLLNGHNFVFVYERIPDDSRNRVVTKLSAVEVFLSGTRERQKAKRTRRHARVPQATNASVWRRPEVSNWFTEDDEERLQRLRNLALHSPDPGVREDAVDNIFFHDDEEAAAKVLAQILQEEPNPDIRYSALEALDGLDPVPRAPVLDAAVYDEESEIRLYALEIIEFEDWEDDQTIATLTTALGDPNQEARLAAVEVLGYLEKRKVLEFAARASYDGEVRKLAWDLLSQQQS